MKKLILVDNPCRDRGYQFFICDEASFYPEDYLEYLWGLIKATE